jgi:hypothetical protein
MIVEGSGVVGGDAGFRNPSTPTLVNNGVIMGGLSISPINLINHGRIESTTGATCDIDNNWDNTTGTIQANGWIYFYGTTTTSAMGTLINNGQMTLESTVNNSAQSFSFGGSTGTWILDGAVVNSGTVSIPSTTQIQSLTLNNVSLGADLTMNIAGIVNVNPGFATNGHNLLLTNGNADIVFRPNGSAFTLDSTTVTLGGNDAGITTDNTSGSSLILGRSASVVGGGYLGAAPSFPTTPLLTNNGSVQAGQGILHITPGAFVNNGTVEATKGGTGLIEPATSFDNIGTVDADGGTITISVSATALSNSGTLESLDGGLITISAGSTWTDAGPLEAGPTSKISVANDLILDSGYDVILGNRGTSGLLQVSGNLNLTDAGPLMISKAQGASISGTFEVASYTGILLGEFQNVTPGYSVVYDVPGKILVSVPEPTSLATTACATAVLLLRRRKRQSSIRGVPNNALTAATGTCSSTTSSASTSSMNGTKPTTVALFSSAVA